MELPEELMMLILSKLPVKSLLRFKCVQKSWYSLINSPQFIHLHRSSKKKNDCFVVRRLIEQQNVLSLHSYETLEVLGNQINLPMLKRFGTLFCGSCDGLVCISNFDQIVICNPTIREFRSLFVPKRSEYLIESVAFGSDPNTGKYTVLVIGVPVYNHEGNYNDREFHLYDFSTDSWRKTGAAIPPCPFEYLHRVISLNGAFHWCPLDDNYNSKNILTFHISNEVTQNIPLPDFSVCCEKQLCVSSKSQLSLILYDFERGWFEIFVMTEYGVKESWARIFKIGSLPLNVDGPPILEFWDEQRLLLKSAQRQLVSCDLEHHQDLRPLPIHGYFDVYPFCESLVSVNGIGM